MTHQSETVELDAATEVGDEEAPICHCAVIEEIRKYNVLGLPYLGRQLTVRHTVENAVHSRKEGTYLFHKTTMYNTYLK